MYVSAPGWTRGITVQARTDLIALELSLDSQELPDLQVTLLRRALVWLELSPEPA